MSSYLMLFSLGLTTSIVCITLGMMFSRYLQIADHPGDHKQHQVSTPFVGGVGIIGATLVVLRLAYDRQLISNPEVWVIAGCALAIFITGFVDDLWRLGYRIRLVIQSLTACVMIYGGGILLTDLGRIVPGVPVELGPLAVLVTIFATLGVINALNMIDGIDGLSGSISLVSLLFLAIVTLAAGQDHDYLIPIIALMAGVIGFLGFNLRCYGRHRALVFLGDNGSMLLGFLLAWLLIGLSQGPAPAMTPVTALWLFAIPLIDTVAVMIRRLWLGRSPFHPDRFHLHHLLLRAGFRTADAVLAIVLLHSLFGVVGLMGLYGGVWESLMFAGFVGAFTGYLYAVSRPWRCIPVLRRLHNRLGLMKADCQGVFVGYFSPEAAPRVLSVLQNEMIPLYEYGLQVCRSHSDSVDPRLYAVLEAKLAEESQSESKLRRLVGRLKERFSADRDMEVRQYVRRDPVNDRRAAQKDIAQDLRRADRRNAHDKTVYETDCFFNRSSSASARVDEEEQ